MKILTFKEALAQSSVQPKKHLLLGNGFSIACRPNIFIYSKLFEQANFDGLTPSTRKVFEKLQTEDFEKVISVLRDARLALEAYAGDNEDLLNSLENDANSLRELLVKTLASSHPAWPGEISEDEYQHCKIFLNYFNKVYTLNYDLLLYWVCMHCEEGEDPMCDDGFRKPFGNYDSDYVTWEPYNSHSQSMYFLHGALHLFDAGYELRKFTWVNTNIRLIDQIRNSLNNGLFPVFVSEGKSSEKMERIRHNDYLAKAYRTFTEITGALFIYGHSLAPNDEHFLERIEQGKLREVYVGIYGNPDNAVNKVIINRAKRMEVNRTKKNLIVSFFDAESANVWSS